MPEDNAPISTTVPETMTVDTGASPEDTAKLSESFKDFWAEEDAPEAPGPAQETTKEALKPSATETKEASTETKPPVTETSKDYTDDEIDAMEVLPNQRPEVYQQFKNVKDLWKADRAKLREESERMKRMESQLAEARLNQLTPELRADYENASALRRRFDFTSDPEFVQKFHAPINQKYEEILDEAVNMLPDREAALKWRTVDMKPYGPDHLSRAWWKESLLDKIPNDLDRDMLRTSINELLKMQKDRNSEISTRTKDKATFDTWIAEKTQATAQRVQEEIMNEIGLQETRIKEVLPRDAAQAKTKEERAAIETHNERFRKLNEFFVTTLKDLSSNGPRAWVRAAVEATRTQIMNDQITNLEKDLKEIRSERDQLKGELEKINGARRRISQTAGTPPATSGPKPNGQGLSLRDLDVRKSFKSFDWGENS